MRLIRFNKAELPVNLLYLGKCLIGICICYALYKLVPTYPFYWAIVSVVLALEPENSNKQAFNRIKANILGCAIGIGLYPFYVPDLLILCIGVIIVVTIGVIFDMVSSLRSALAALVIITIQVEQGKHWYVAFERVICVVTGCVVALLVTLLFTLIENKTKVID